MCICKHIRTHIVICIHTSSVQIRKLVNIRGSHITHTFDLHYDHTTYTGSHDPVTWSKLGMPGTLITVTDQWYLTVMIDQ